MEGPVCPVCPVCAVCLVGSLEALTSGDALGDAGVCFLVPDGTDGLWLPAVVLG